MNRMTAKISAQMNCCDVLYIRSHIIMYIYPTDRYGSAAIRETRGGGKTMFH